MICPYIDKKCGTHSQCIKCDNNEKVAQWICETWIDKITKTYVCSNCKDSFIPVDRTPESGRMNYCPNCGFYMLYRE